MKIFILGAGGMIGHKMYQVLSQVFPETYACVKRSKEEFKEFKIFNPLMVLDRVDVTQEGLLESVLDKIKPDVILNCVGVTLRKKEIHNLSYCLEVNSLMPHRIKCWTAKNEAYLIHFSTDCVFSGKEGEYLEDSPPSAEDIYGKTKYLGEVTGANCLTLRGSMIGRELYGKTELLEWALSQAGNTIKGYSQALYSGVTTDVMAGLVLQILKRPGYLKGLYQVSSVPISKLDLLQKINQAYNLNMKIQEDCGYGSKKDLVSSKIQREIGFICPSWDEMINQLVSSKTSFYQ